MIFAFPVDTCAFTGTNASVEIEITANTQISSLVFLTVLFISLVSFLSDRTKFFVH